METADEKKEEPKMFEVGKFYKIPVMCGFSSKNIASRCSRILKYKIEFEHFRINFANVRELVKQKYKRYSPSYGFKRCEMCGSGEKWSMLGFGYASDEIEKPEWWDEHLKHVGEKIESEQQGKPK